jgi:hypothetical protein
MLQGPSIHDDKNVRQRTHHSLAEEVYASIRLAWMVLICQFEVLLIEPVMKLESDADRKLLQQRTMASTAIDWIWHEWALDSQLVFYISCPKN